jgi:hypothetical protein
MDFNEIVIAVLAAVIVAQQIGFYIERKWLVRAVMAKHLPQLAHAEVVSRQPKVHIENIEALADSQESHAPRISGDDERERQIQEIMRANMVTYQEAVNFLDQGARAPLDLGS